jgi:protein-tyrosine kinase
MSRIHEALRKAEQERADHAPIDVPSLLGTTPVQIPTTIQSSASVPVPASAPPPIPGMTGFEELRQRCATPDWKLDPRNIVFSNDNPSPLAAEQFRTLRSRLYRFCEKKTRRRLLVTSSLPAEGKTFVAVNLAHAFAREHDRRVLLIDADLRASRLHLALGAPLAPGLSDFLRGEADEFSVTQCSAAGNLFFIGGGIPGSNPTELLASGRLKSLLDRMTPMFDWIILDSPPVIPVADAGLLADHSDGVLLVVQAGGTPYDVARKVSAELREKNLIGVVLNRAEEMGSYYSSYYYQYGGSGKDKHATA